MIYMMIDYIFCAPYIINPRHVILPICWGTAYGYFHLVLNAKTGTIMYQIITETDNILIIPATIGNMSVLIVSFYILYWIGQRKRRRSFCRRCCFFADDDNTTEEDVDDNDDDDDDDNDNIVNSKKEQDEEKPSEGTEE